MNITILLMHRNSIVNHFSDCMICLTEFRHSLIVLHPSNNLSVAVRFYLLDGYRWHTGLLQIFEANPNTQKHNIREKNHNYSILQFHRNLTVFMCKLCRKSMKIEIYRSVHKGKNLAKSKWPIAQIRKK